MEPVYLKRDKSTTMKEPLSPVRVGKRRDSEKTDAGISIAEIKEVKARAELLKP
jgi:hypothetical protein